MTDTPDRSQQLLALEPRLLESAGRMTGDDAQAQLLVLETLKIALDPSYGTSEVVDPQVWIFRLLRQQFHILGRDQERRRSRAAANAQNNPPTAPLAA